MNSPVPSHPFSRPPTRVALLMILAGVLGAAVAGSASAAAPRDDVPQIVLQYSPDSLATDGGARRLYRRLVRAAEEVCPAAFADGPFVSQAVRQCRTQAVERAVRAIDSPRLAQVYAGRVKRG